MDSGCDNKISEDHHLINMRKRQFLFSLVCWMPLIYVIDCFHFYSLLETLLVLRTKGFEIASHRVTNARTENVYISKIINTQLFANDVLAYNYYLYCPPFHILHSVHSRSVFENRNISNIRSFTFFRGKMFLYLCLCRFRGCTFVLACGLTWEVDAKFSMTRGTKRICLLYFSR